MGLDVGDGLLRSEGVGGADAQGHEACGEGSGELHGELGNGDRALQVPVLDCVLERGGTTEGWAARRAPFISSLGSTQNERDSRCYATLRIPISMLPYMQATANGAISRTSEHMLERASGGKLFV